MRRLTGRDVNHAVDHSRTYEAAADYLNALLFADNDEFRTKDEPWLCGSFCGGSSLRLSQGWDVARRMGWYDAGDCSGPSVGTVYGIPVEVQQ